MPLNRAILPDCLSDFRSPMAVVQDTGKAAHAGCVWTRKLDVGLLGAGETEDDCSDLGWKSKEPKGRSVDPVRAMGCLLLASRV